MSLNILKSKWRLFFKGHPLVRGMVSYAVIWPTSNLIQQTFEGKNLKTYDWLRALRFSVFGTFYMAPTLYYWMRISSAMWPQMSLKVGIIKAIVDQFTYGPFCYCSFFYVMKLLELKTPKEAAKEVRNKFWPTYQTGTCFWAFMQTINYTLIPESNRLMFASFCSLIWTTFLAYMESKRLPARTPQITEKEVESET